MKSCVKVERNGAYGWLRVNTTLCGPTARTCSGVRTPFQSQENPFFSATIRWKEKTTSSAVSSLPSWKRIPFRIWKVYVLAPSVTRQDSATCGPGSIDPSATFG